MSVSKKIRFEVFKRDGFQCAYCGKTPPEVTLECDHIEPVSKGGTDDIENLITACFDCNRGKTNIPLDKAPAKLSENAEILREKEEQLKEYRKIVAKVERRIQKDIDQVEAVFKECYEDWSFSNHFRNSSVKRFINQLPLDVVIESMRTACIRIKSDRDRTIKYFCGICWKTIKNG